MPFAVRSNPAASSAPRFQRAPLPRPPIADPYLEFVRQTLDRHPRLRATRLYQTIHRRKNLKAH